MESMHTGFDTAETLTKFVRRIKLVCKNGLMILSVYSPIYLAGQTQNKTNSFAF